MASPDPNTDREDNRRGSRISLQTLIVASLASAAAAFAASRIWGTGTLISAAITPVVVALVSEFLRRPVQTVAATARKIPPAQTLPAVRGRTNATPDHRVRELQDPARVSTNPATPAEPPSRSGQLRPRRRVEPPAAITPVVDPAMVKDAEAHTWRPRWRPAVVTGLLAFAIVVALYTVPDLLAGHSVTGNGQPSTFFGGSATVTTKTTPTTTVTTTTSATTVTKTAPATSTTRITTSAATTTTTPTTTTPTSTQTPSTTPPAGNPATTPTSPAP